MDLSWVLGTKQSGLPEFKEADIIRDEKILKEARQTAFHLIKDDLNLTKPENKAIACILADRVAKATAPC